MPVNGPSRDFFNLKRRVGRFLLDPQHFRSSVNQTLMDLEVFGEVAIVGGMLRDMLLREYHEFYSDVDVVVDASDLDAFDAAMSLWGARRNSFGGYALEHLPWRVDVWALSRTWAHVAGHREVNHLNDILQTTFFNWDAILYLPRGRKFLTAPPYLDQLRARYLDMNLKPNPNPTANLIRMLRAARRHNATISPRLVAFALEAMDGGIADEVLLAEEQRIYRRRKAILTQSDLDTARAAFQKAAHAREQAMPFPRTQMPLLVQDVSRAPSQVQPRRSQRRKEQVQERLSI